MTKTPVSPDLIALSHRLADAAGEVIRRYFRLDFHIDNKSDGIHGEEFGSDADKAGYLLGA